MDKPDSLYRPQFEMLPPEHPMREEVRLTLIQQFALPILLWFFDTDRARRQGRSYLAAFVALELAKRGHHVSLADGDPSLSFTGPLTVQLQRHFFDTILKVWEECYADDMFNVEMNRRELTYKGRRPQ